MGGPATRTPARQNLDGRSGTAGGLLFYGKPNGGFDAVDAKTGETLWHFPTNVRMKAPPITFSVGGATICGCGRRAEPAYALDSDLAKALSSSKAKSRDLSLTEWRNSPSCFSAVRKRSAKCRQASTAVRAESRLPARRAMLDMSSSISWASAIVSCGSPDVLSAYV